MTVEDGRVGEDEAVRVFVEFGDVEGATRAVEGLDGRFFAKRRVKCVRYDERMYHEGKLI